MDKITKEIPQESMEFLIKLGEDFNEFSKLVSLNYEQLDEIPIDKEKERQAARETLQWNRGQLYRIGKYHEDFAKLLGIKGDS